MKRLAMLAALATSALVASSAGLIETGAAQAAALPTVTLAQTGPTTGTVTGPLQSGAVNIVASSTTKEANAILFQVKPGSSAAEVIKYVNTHKIKDPNEVAKFGSIAFDVEANPGAKTEAQMLLVPGEYVFLGGATNGEPKPMSTFTVSASPAPVALPTPQATEKTIEFGFRGPTTLHDGELVRFENEGFLVHMDFAVPVKSARAAKQLIVSLKAGREKGLEKLFAGPPAAFAGPLSSGAFQQETITAKPGLYVQLCFMETQDGRSHTRLGMERMIKIVK
jgi:hypothetical protein